MFLWVVNACDATKALLMSYTALALLLSLSGKPLLIPVCVGILPAHIINEMLSLADQNVWPSRLSNQEFNIVCDYDYLHVAFSHTHFKVEKRQGSTEKLIFTSLEMLKAQRVMITCQKMKQFVDLKKLESTSTEKQPFELTSDPPIHHYGNPCFAFLLSATQLFRNVEDVNCSKMFYNCRNVMEKSLISKFSSSVRRNPFNP